MCHPCSAHYYIRTSRAASRAPQLLRAVCIEYNLVQLVFAEGWLSEWLSERLYDRICSSSSVAGDCVWGYCSSPDKGFGQRSFFNTFRHQTAMINGVRLHYVTGGKGPAVVLIHGLPASWYEWRGILQALAERYTVIAPDLRGLGDSSKPPGGYDTHTAAEDIHQLVHSMGIDRVYVAGHDWGAAVGFAYAVRYPQEVRRLAILDMTIPGFGAEDGFRVTRQGGSWHTIFHMAPDVPEALITGRERQYLSIFYSGLYGSGDNPTAINKEEIDEYIRVYTKPGALRAYLSYYRSLFNDADRNREGTKIKLSTCSCSGRRARHGRCGRWCEVEGSSQAI